MKNLVLDLDRYAPALITFVANKLSAGASRTYRKHFGVGVSEWRIMSLLAIEPNITANRITQVIGLDKAAVSRSLEALRERNFVSITADANDGRQRIIALTPQGKEMHDKIILVALERERRLLACFTEEEVDTLFNLLVRMHAQIAEVDAYDPGSHDSRG
jgi:DNA-binding MarR family transcriptional regulator